jgi:hypothetical protein
MERKIIDKVEGWEISLNRNVHMYCHSLSVEKGNDKISISCEDLPTKEKTIGIWLHTLEEPEEIKKELAQVLLDWTKKLEVKFQIYTGRDNFLTNKNSA